MLVTLGSSSARAFERNRFSLNCRISYNFAQSTCSSCSSESFRNPQRLKAQLLMTLPMLLPKITSKLSYLVAYSISAENLLRTLSLQTAWQLWVRASRLEASVPPGRQKLRDQLKASIRARSWYCLSSQKEKPSSSYSSLEASLSQQQGLLKNEDSGLVCSSQKALRMWTGTARLQVASNLKQGKMSSRCSPLSTLMRQDLRNSSASNYIYWLRLPIIYSWYFGTFLKNSQNLMQKTRMQLRLVQKPRLWSCFAGVSAAGRQACGELYCPWMPQSSRQLRMYSSQVLAFFFLQSMLISSSSLEFSSSCQQLWLSRMGWYFSESDYIQSTLTVLRGGEEGLLLLLLLFSLGKLAQSSEVFCYYCSSATSRRAFQAYLNLVTAYYFQRLSRSCIYSHRRLQDFGETIQFYSIASYSLHFLKYFWLSFSSSLPNSFFIVPRLNFSTWSLFFGEHSQDSVRFLRSERSTSVYDSSVLMAAGNQKITSRFFLSNILLLLYSYYFQSLPNLRLRALTCRQEGCESLLSVLSSGSLAILERLALSSMFSCSSTLNRPYCSSIFFLSFSSYCRKIGLSCSSALLLYENLLRLLLLAEMLL